MQCGVGGPLGLLASLACTSQPGSLAGGCAFGRTPRLPACLFSLPAAIRRSLPKHQRYLAAWAQACKWGVAPLADQRLLCAQKAPAGRFLAPPHRKATAVTDSPLRLRLPHLVKGKASGYAALDKVWLLALRACLPQFTSPSRFHALSLPSCIAPLPPPIPFAFLPNGGVSGPAAAHPFVGAGSGGAVCNECAPIRFFWGVAWLPSFFV